MKLNWFAPLPPAKTGIADYTAGLLPWFSKAAEVILWTDQPTWDRSLEDHAVVRNYDPGRMDWVVVNQADLSFYNLGNNHRFHAAIWQVSRRSPGIVVLHDTRLHDFFESLYRGHWRDEHGYLEQMERSYGVEGLRAAAEFVNTAQPDYDAMASRFPMTPAALENSLGVVVHTKEAFEELRLANRWPVVHAPLPFSGPIHGQKDYVPPADKFRLIVFGHIGRNRRLSAVLQALASLPQKNRFHLDIYGEMDEPKSLRSQIQSLNLKQNVTVHGYVHPDKLDQALAAASLAINLRYPTMGEASASQLRIWTHALPTLVTRVGWYGSLLEETVAHVRPEQEVEDIKTHLTAFLEDPQRFVRMGNAGRIYLEREHHPAAYVKTLVSLASDAAQFNQRKTAHDLAKRSGELLALWTNDDDSAERVAKKIHELTA